MSTIPEQNNLEETLGPNDIGLRTQLTSGVARAVNTYNGIDGNSVVPASGYYNFKNQWPLKGAIPQSISTGGWGIDDKTKERGYVQQTFLGASIRNFNMNGGFGDSSSTLSVDLVVDEYNKSDNTIAGFGDDVYHSGGASTETGDYFRPPIAGSPVFFKFGPNFATVEQAYRKTFYNIYGTSGTVSGFGLDSIFNTGGGGFNIDNFQSLPDSSFVRFDTNAILNLAGYLNIANDYRGENHLVFGGILQSYTQNRGTNGGPLYSVQVVDPREILSNTMLILNNYAGSTYNAKNIYNIYGFLEHNMSLATSGTLQSQAGGPPNIIMKHVNQQTGEISISGNISNVFPYDCFVQSSIQATLQGLSYKQKFFPVTGTGFSRRGKQGIPFYRVEQALAALMEVQMPLPAEYKNIGFGGPINFRGYNYVVDLTGLPRLPPLYYIDFDQMSLLDLCLEICEVSSRDLFVSLLPVINNHPACSYIYGYNQGQPPSGIIAGIIRVDSIDRSNVPQYGAIKTYIDSLSGQGVYVESQDVGYELSNVTTDKFVAGAQEVDMYYFSSNADRDVLTARNRQNQSSREDQWRLHKQFEQQILPYYGKLGNTAVTIPKGWGSYQQILLDSTGLNANGVGSYYVATEMELRCASVSYDCWKNFLVSYNDTYVESVEDDDTFEGAALQGTPSIVGGGAPAISSNYAVTVPRSVFETYENVPFGTDNLPKSPCNPPYGYPLYYKRAAKIGIPEGGLTKLQSRLTRMITGAATIRGADGENYDEIKNAELKYLEDIANYGDGQISSYEQQYYSAVKGALATTPPNVDLLNNIEVSLHSIQAILPRLAKKGTENALKVYEFVKKIADECLGKKFLVKIPKEVNLWYDNEIQYSANGEYRQGPFGFPPRPLNPNIDYFTGVVFKSLMTAQRQSTNMMKAFLSSGVLANSELIYPPIHGALSVNFNPISSEHEFNYMPSNLGGYFPFDLCANTFTTNQLSNMTNLPSGVKQLLIPQDCTNFINEDGRMSPYVRFDHSQDLSLGPLSSEDYTQQIIKPQGMIPDLCEYLDNVGEDKFESFTDADANRPDIVNRGATKTCAFVKCSVDEKLYMPPKHVTSGITVYGGATSVERAVRPRKIFIPCSGISGGQLVPGSGVWVDSFTFTKLNFKANQSAVGGVSTSIFNKTYDPILNNFTINTEIQDLDTDNVYALITLPQKIIPTKDSRYRDAMNQKDGSYSIKHYLTVDVVKGLPEFNSPAFASKPSIKNIALAGRNFSAENRSIAWIASKKAKEQLKFSLPNQLETIAPSPVYPDLVALPLMSRERCYGPWLSSQVDPQSSGYINIGGKVEFIKDENLAPWNYAGYTLMNDAGVIQAQFANSLLLFSERGGFVVPGMPQASLCNVLLSGGPLVTNVSVDVSEGGIKTTYKMDMYTASFGKLQKQKQEMISKISRERQRLMDQRNALIRKGIGKSQSSFGIGSINALANEGKFDVLTHLVGSVDQVYSAGYSPQVGGNSRSFGDEPTDSDPEAGNLSGCAFVNSVSLQSSSRIADTANRYDNIVQQNEAMSKTGAVPLEKMFTVYSEDPSYFGCASLRSNPRRQDLNVNEE